MLTRAKEISFRGSRRGFTAVEILVSLAIVAILTGIVVPQITGRIRESRRSALAQTLFGLTQGIAEYKKAVTRYPSRLSLLTAAPVAGSSQDACGAVLSATNANNWRGPYVSRQLLATGIPMGDGNISDVLQHVPGPPTYLLINTTNVDEEIALLLEAELDGGVASSTAGTIRYTTPAQGQVTLSYALPISGC
jgi:prepilin-type N-terminal cleavage/methylation domain-containing protein